MLCPRFMAFARSRCSDESNGIGQTGFFMVRWPGKKVLMKIYIIFIFHSSIFFGYCLKKINNMSIIVRISVDEDSCQSDMLFQNMTSNHKWQEMTNKRQSMLIDDICQKNCWRVVRSLSVCRQTKVEGGNRNKNDKYDKQRWKMATETNMTNTTESNMDWDNMV